MVPTIISLSLLVYKILSSRLYTDRQTIKIITFSYPTCNKSKFIYSKKVLSKNSKFISQLFDDLERHDLKSQPWLLFSPFLFTPKKRGNKKRRMNSKIEILRHAFLDHQ